MIEEKKESKNRFAFLANLSIFKKLKQVKHIGLIITIIFILILVLILFGNFNFSSKLSANTGTTSTYISSAEYTEKLEAKLESVLGKVSGAKNVEVMITLESGTSYILASNSETRTTTNSDGTTTTVVSNPIIIENDDKDNPIIINEILPKIRGVIVVSSGASDVNVRLNLLNAVQTLLDVPTGQIQILIGTN